MTSCAVPKALNCACSDALATEWVAQWCADRVNDFGWYQFDVAVMDEDVPTGVVYVPMVRFAQQNAIIYTGLTTINPMLPVVRLAHSRGSITARENTIAVPGDQRSTD
jgi:hypothetical protein